MGPRELAERRAPNLVPPGAPPEVVAELVRVMAQVRPSGYSAAAIVMGTADLRARLNEIRVPTLVLHGECDSVIPTAVAEELARAIPDARLVVIRGGGHASNQHKIEAYNAAVREFIRSVA
jgi:pimeloyl-ACP methyl ester carboxylesterase